VTPHLHALTALALAASRIPEGIPPPPDRYDALCAALALAWPHLPQDARDAALDDPDAALAELLAEHDGAEDGPYRESVAGLIAAELAA